ncbi:uncharacterized protein C8A04DRAFT_11437 [Dichotomopilus funicola]|uniref:PLD phosphodiesterase domain-containing protein n=1 Tax=Dichotomopilus funicola TaxID=1934379 RepID=A0AAN6ZPK2_9PEZI|nr:hypothetical protein C8A04DRAFT_11437 [Dichotomopilus funicola]
MANHQRQIPRLNDHTIRLCTSDESVSSLVARNPDLAPGDAWKKLHGDDAWKHLEGRGRHEDKFDDSEDKTELSRTAECGKWGPTKPSELFLRIYHDALCTIHHEPHRAMVSPSLMGSYGTVPLTIISALPDLARHMSNVIVRAKQEVFLATNYWQDSVASKYITNAIKELDRRARMRGTKIVVKILYDRGSLKQLYEHHYVVPEKESTGKNVNLPHAHEIPNISMEVMNFHTPIVGTFHAKYVVVDRKIALLQSNNIQDNDNLEMLVHLEGPIVDSLYDMALLSWHKKMEPPLPSRDKPATQAWPESRREGEHGRSKDNSSENGIEGREHPSLPQHTTDNPCYDDDISGEVARINAALAPRPEQTHLQAVTLQLNHTTNEGLPGDPNAPECPPGELMTPYLPLLNDTPYPMALVNRAPYGPPTHKSVETPQNAAWLSALRNAKKSVYIISPTLNAPPLVEAIVEACERGVDVHCYICISYNDAGELLPRQGGHNEKVAATLHKSLTPSTRRHLHYRWYVAKDQTRPITQARRQRSSHVKLMIVDGAVGIQGNGNQDTQSWFHSQEINIMVDSVEVCAKWLEGLRQNQNTALFGAVNLEDGVWRDENGNGVEGAMGVDAGRVRGWARGVKGAVDRVRGTGGF